MQVQLVGFQDPCCYLWRSEYFKLVDLCQTMILGSVEDERMFSALTFLKSKLNKLDKIVDACLRLYVTKYGVDDFPYERELSLW